MVSLLLATNNPDKIREIQAILDGLHIELRLLAPADIGLHIDVIEDGKTYAENAAKKATAFSRAAMMPALADDSGLEVAALNGAPGINSHRYAPNFNATDADRRKYLLQNLEGKTRPWLARFYCVVAIAAPHLKKIEYGVGEVRGLIIPDERGTGGFMIPSSLFPNKLKPWRSSIWKKKTQFHTVRVPFAPQSRSSRLFNYPNLC
jgi:XTP/dITP diphosphohydrolase